MKYLIEVLSGYIADVFIGDHRSIVDKDIYMRSIGFQSGFHNPLRRSWTQQITLHRNGGGVGIGFNSRDQLIGWFFGSITGVRENDFGSSRGQIESDGFADPSRRSCDDGTTRVVGQIKNLCSCREAYTLSCKVRGCAGDGMLTSVNVNGRIRSRTVLVKSPTQRNG